MTETEPPVEILPSGLHIVRFAAEPIAVPVVPIPRPRDPRNGEQQCQHCGKDIEGWPLGYSKESVKHGWCCRHGLTYTCQPSCLPEGTFPSCPVCGCDEEHT